MTNNVKRASNLAMAATALAALALMTGCASTISKEVNDQGQAKEVVFPDPAKDAKQPEGSHPNSENLGKLRTGLTKTQVYELIGTPHYSEGFGAREWDYLLHQSSSDAVCQLKLIYDKQMLVGSIHTKPEGCVKLK